MIEKDIEQALRRGIRTAIPNALCLKFVTPGFTGVPDRIVLLPGGRVVFVELKRPGEKPRQRQLFVQSRLRKLGFPVFGCVDTLEKVDAVVWQCQLLATATDGRKEVNHGGGGV